MRTKEEHIKHWLKSADDIEGSGLQIPTSAGNEVYKERLAGMDNSISILKWSVGVYFYSLTPTLSKGEGDVMRGKFVVVR
jgi:hypothetical protein